MNFKFKYYKIGKFKRSLIKVRLQNINQEKGEKFEYLALVDSGADFCIFHSDSVLTTILLKCQYIFQMKYQ